MRTLASIKRISSVSDIPGKDRIGIAMIDGWSVIVQKSEMHAGDLVVFCEIDSLLPDKPEFEFLKNGKGLRIRTLKMSGVISQGICFPLSILPDGDYPEGTDVTEIMGVTKWEPPDVTDVKEPAENKPSKKYPAFLMRFKFFRNWVYKQNHKEGKAFPSEVSKTDETRVQNAPWYLSMDTKWTVTEKVDGQSGTFLLRKVKSKNPFKKESYEYIVCSRNLRLFNKDNSSYWRVSDRYGIENALKQLMHMYDCEWVAIQGECIAPGVQGNKYNVFEPDLYVFNLITSDRGRLPSVEGKGTMESLGMKWVPIVAEEAELPKTVEEMLDMAHGDSALGNTIREGLVCRSLDGKQSFKAVDPLFLIKYDA